MISTAGNVKHLKVSKRPRFFFFFFSIAPEANARITRVTSNAAISARRYQKTIPHIIPISALRKRLASLGSRSHSDKKRRTYSNTHESRNPAHSVPSVIHDSRKNDRQSKTTLDVGEIRAKTRVTLY